jgi:RNA polymerase sigma factor (sigma-70 family)
MIFCWWHSSKSLSPSIPQVAKGFHLRAVWNILQLRALFITMFGSKERLYNAWVHDHYRFLFRSAWALTRSRSVAEEVVQDCFELAWRHMDQLKDKALVKPWLFQILRREALRNLAPSTDAYAQDEDLRVANDSVGELEQRIDVLRALHALAPIHREVLTLFYFEDMPVADMAMALELAPGTVLSRLHRAREAFRAVMLPRHPDLPAKDSGSAEVVELRAVATVRGNPMK